MTDEQKREHFRVEYPLHYRPTVTLDGQGYEVRDISERGIALDTEDTSSFTVGEIVSGSIEFLDGETCDCRGEIIRKLESLVVIRLSKGIPLEIIRSEQILLIRWRNT